MAYTKEFPPEVNQEGNSKNKPSGCTVTPGKILELAS